MQEIKIVNNWLSSELHEYISHYFLNDIPHHYGHKSHPSLPDNYSFYKHDFINDPLVDYLKFKLKKQFNKDIEFLRTYINIQHPNMETVFHRDDGDVTVLYMVSGEGNFKIINDFEVVQEKNSQTSEIKPKDIEEINFEKNKLIIFNAQKPHKGEPPKKGVRISLAFKTKFKEKNE